MIKKILLGFISLLVFTSASALDVKLTPNKDYVEVLHEGKIVRVQRIQDQSHTLIGGFSKTSRKCPPFCIQPISPLEGIKTVGEYEIFDFMENELTLGEGVIVDARVPSWHKRGTIPGSINIPFKVFEKDDEDLELIEAFEQLGAISRGDVGSFKRTLESYGFMDGDLKTDKWDFSGAKTVLLWCNGPWCGQSPRAIRALVKHGFPKAKIRYYRGGMQNWQILGLTTVIPTDTE